MSVIGCKLEGLAIALALLLLPVPILLSDVTSIWEYQREKNAIADELAQLTAQIDELERLHRSKSEYLSSQRLAPITRPVVLGDIDRTLSKQSCRMRQQNVQATSPIIDGLTVDAIMLNATSALPEIVKCVRALERMPEYVHVRELNIVPDQSFDRPDHSIGLSVTLEWWHAGGPA